MARQWQIVLSGRDVEAIGGATRTQDISQLDLMERGHRFAKTVINMPAPVIVEMKGWSIGGSFERGVLCDMRIAGESARMMLPEIKHGVIPDTGGIALGSFIWQATGSPPISS